MAQCLAGWEKMIEEEQEEARYQTLYGDPNSMSLERTQKLEEIIGLQYEINTLLGQKNGLEQKSSESMGQERCFSEDMYRMLAVQAVSM